MASWKQYQTALAKSILRGPQSETILCEWDILGQTGQDVYVWAICGAQNSGDKGPAVVHLNTDGSIKFVEDPGNGSNAEANTQKMFPAGVRKKSDSYFALSYSGRAREMAIHLQYRLIHPDVPPLIVLAATPMP